MLLIYIFKILICLQTSTKVKFIRSNNTQISFVNSEYYRYISKLRYSHVYTFVCRSHYL